jgi:type IV pilus assembly protein PilY1
VSSFNGQVNQSSDDAAQTGSTVTTTDTDDTFSQANATYLGFRFQNVEIPQGATTTAATISLYIVSAKNSTAGNGSLDCQLATNPATFSTDSNDISSRVLTGNAITWSMPSVSSVGYITSPNIASAVQPVVDHISWQSGDSLVVVLFNPDGNVNEEVDMYDDGDGNAATISITFTVSGDPPVGGVLTMNGCVVCFPGMNGPLQLLL